MTTVDNYNQQLGMIIPRDTHVSRNDLATVKTVTKPDGARSILVQALTQNVRFTLDSTTPTSSVGFQLKAGDPPVLIPVYNATIRFIQETATASLQYQWSSV